MSFSNMRHELKYVEDLAIAENFLAEAVQFCSLDSHAGADGYYETSSIYYDTDSLRFFWDRQESVGFRRKVRLRSYSGGTSEPVIFFEIKEKHKNLVSKKRCSIVTNDINLDLSNKETFEIDNLLQYASSSIAKNEIEYLHGRLNLKPVVNVRYVRKALAGICDPSLRITLDKRLTAGAPVMTPYQSETEPFFLPPSQSILEIKSENSLPLWLVSMIQRYEFTRSRYSKYCSAVEQIFEPKREQFRETTSSLNFDLP
jgi:hypothetical protein